MMARLRKAWVAGKGRLARSYHAHRAIRSQSWEVVTCACGMPYYRLVMPHPDARCARCESLEMQRWAAGAQMVRRIG